MAEQIKITELSQALWNCADILRSKMDANEYKNYLLGLVFYKYLSDKMLFKAADLLEEPTQSLTEAQKIYEENYHDEDIQEDLIEELQYSMSFSIEPEVTFTALVEQINRNSFQLETLQQGFRDLEQSDSMFENLFDDVDLYSRRLGSTPQKQNQTISQLILELDKINLGNYSGDALGDAYEFLLGKFASESGKKAGEFYTPQQVSELMTRIAIDGKENQQGFTAYDAAMGSGSLLLNVGKYSNHPKKIGYYGQELNTSTYNLARMNMIIHGVPKENQHLRNADTLENDWPTEEPTNYDAVLMNPPYSAKWSSDAGFLDDPRFAPYGRLAPKSKADYAFLLHGFYHLKEDGVMCIVLPHGVLFRGGAEGTIRKALLERGAIHTVIGLPSNLFYSTSIPTTIIVLKKDNIQRDVLFIDASNEFEKIKTQNQLTEENIQKILDTYRNREGVEKYAHLASFEEIVENDYNLNIPRYVDTYEEPEPIDIVQVSKDIKEIDAEIEKTKAELLDMVGDLQVNDESKDIIQALKEVFS
ncbi:type I restriction-modification system subunit M [Aerococcaceae bacterium DSM 111020]|nr:type I restriction-modification system subunit M [Aerococcaceae bacterium DSM 111020]